MQVMYCAVKLFVLAAINSKLSQHRTKECQVPSQGLSVHQARPQNQLHIACESANDRCNKWQLKRIAKLGFIQKTIRNYKKKTMAMFTEDTIEHRAKWTYLFFEGSHLLLLAQTRSPCRLSVHLAPA